MVIWKVTKIQAYGTWGFAAYEALFGQMLFKNRNH